MDRNLEKTYRLIKELEIQGATSVAQAILEALGQYGQKVKAPGIEQWRSKIEEAANRLLSARPTEPMAQNGVKFLLSNLEKVENVKQARPALGKAIEDFSLLINDAHQLLIENAQPLIQDNQNIFVHCHSSSVVDILKKGFAEDEKFEVFNSETRPLYQGRITAKELTEAGIPVTMVVDSAVPFFISSLTGSEYDMDMFLIGADALLKDGSTYNKIGSYGMSVAAEYNDVPVYVAASLLKYYPYPEVEIEVRSPEEVWENAPSEVDIINYAFDEVLQEGIEGIITEAGIIKPEQVESSVRKTYPWLL